MREPLISVIVPVYKVEQYLCRCIDSIIDQSYKNLEIILIDDGSPDKCPQICDSYAQKDQRITVIHKTNEGLSAARNIGLDNIKGEYVTFVDSDDFLHNDFIIRLYFLCSNNNCQIAQCSFEKGEKDELSFFDEKVTIVKYDHNEIFIHRSFKIIACAKLYKSSLFKGIRFPVGKINEDEFTTYKVVFAADHIILTNEKLYYYYQSQNSIMRNRNNYIKLDFIEAYEERVQFFRKMNIPQQIDISIKELSIRLMLCYIMCKSRRNNLNNTTELLQQFKQNYLKVYNSKFLHWKEKIILFIFNFLPDITALLVNKLRLR